MKILNPNLTVSPADKKWVLLMWVVVMVAIVALQTSRFASQNYSGDELNTVYAAQTRSTYDTIVWLSGTATTTHPPGWRVAAVGWVKTFGETEPLTRWFGVMFTLLGMAMVARLAQDLFDLPTALLGLLFVGFSPFFLWHTHEFRPYAAVFMTTAGLLLFFGRWLHHPTFRYALLYVLMGIIGMQAHFFVAYVVMAQALYMVIGVRWRWDMWWRAFGFFVMIAASLGGWYLFVLRTVLDRGGGIYGYETSLSGFNALLVNLQYAPIMLFLLILFPMRRAYPIIRPAPDYLRYADEHPRVYVLSVGLGMLVIAFIINIGVRNITDRNMTILLGPTMLAGGYIFRILNPRLGWPLAGLIALVGLVNVHGYQTNIPMNEMTAVIAPAYQPNDRVVTVISRGDGETETVIYYLAQFIPAQPPLDHFFAISEPDSVETDPIPLTALAAHARDAEPATMARFDVFLDSTDRIWYIEYAGPPRYADRPLTPVYHDIIKADFVAIQTWTFPYRLGRDEIGTYTLILYQRRR